MIRPGERVALLGHNGAGKTTLIHQIMRAFESEGSDNTVKLNPQCQIGFYDQELQRLNPEETMMSCLRNACHKSDSELKSAMIRAGIPYKDLDKKISVLSGGEKARLMFLIIKMNKPNFLILDEPTNHIDIQGKEELEQQILEANATVLITSHDRRFVDNIAQRFVLIKDGKLLELHDPMSFYEDTVQELQSESRTTTSSKSDNEETVDVLTRIVELEELLAADLARKPKFQKPKLQDEWRAELKDLNKQL